MKTYMNRWISPIRTFVFMGMVALASGMPICAQGVPVIDLSNILQSILNTSNQLQQWYQQIKGMREAYSLAHAAYSGMKDWNGLNWVDSLQAFKLPWFDGIPNIDEYRQLAAAGVLSVDQLKAIFKESELIARMKQDPLMQNPSFAARVQLWSDHYDRVVRLRIALTRTMEAHQDEIKSIEEQAKLVQAKIQSLAALDPAPMGAIQALQAKLQGLEVKLSGNRSAIEELKKEQELKEQHDLEVVRAKQAMTDEEYAQRQRDMKSMLDTIGLGRR